MQEKETADSGRQLERVRVVARKRSIAEVAEHSTGVINKPHPLLCAAVDSVVYNLR